MQVRLSVWIYFWLLEYKNSIYILYNLDPDNLKWMLTQNKQGFY